MLCIKYMWRNVSQNIFSNNSSQIGRHFTVEAYVKVTVVQLVVLVVQTLVFTFCTNMFCHLFRLITFYVSHTCEEIFHKIYFQIIRVRLADISRWKRKVTVVQLVVSVLVSVQIWNRYNRGTHSLRLRAQNQMKNSPMCR